MIELLLDDFTWLGRTDERTNIINSNNKKQTTREYVFYSIVTDHRNKTKFKCGGGATQKNVCISEPHHDAQSLHKLKNNFLKRIMQKLNYIHVIHTSVHTKLLICSFIVQLQIKCWWIGWCILYFIENRLNFFLNKTK